MKRFILPVLALSGCLQAAPPEVSQAAPEQAIAYHAGITVTMSDGSLCIAQRPGTALSWSGNLTGCATPLDYVARLPDGQKPRVVLVRNPTGAAVIEVGGQVFGL